MDSNNVLGELLEKGQNVASATVSDVATSISDQVGLKNEASAPATQVQNQTQQQPLEASQNSIEESQRTKEMVKDFYSSSDDLAQNNVQPVMVTEEQQLAQVRQKLYQELHSDVYYQPLISYEQSKPAERPAEKLERQQMEELQVKEEKKQNDLPIAVLRAQAHTEMTPGIAG